MYYSLRMEHPPPVPVTQPKVQNLAHSEGMRFAGWFSSSEQTRWSLLGLVSSMVGSSCAGAGTGIGIAGQIIRGWLLRGGGGGNPSQALRVTSCFLMEDKMPLGVKHMSLVNMTGKPLPLFEQIHESLRCRGRQVTDMPRPACAFLTQVHLHQPSHCN